MSADEQLREIDAIQRDGRVDDALALLRVLVADHPQLAEGHARLGGVLLEVGRYREAQCALSHAVELAPDRTLAWCLYAEASHRSGSLELAAEAYRRAIGLAPRFVRAYNNLGLVLAEQGRGEAAIKVFEAALSIEPAYAPAQNNLGSVLASCGNDAAASEAFAGAVRIDPRFFEAWLNLGLAHLRLGRNVEARASLQTALQLRPGAAAALLPLASLLEREGTVGHAHAVLQQGVDAGCGEPDVVLECARMLAELNRPEQARALYTSVHRQCPTDLRAVLGMHLTLPRVYGPTRDVEAAREAFCRGLGALESVVESIELPALSDLLAQLAWVNFHLAYQGGNDRPLQRRYGAWLTRLLERGGPELMHSRRARPQERIRLGFASALWRRGTVSAYFGSWLSGLDARRFDVHFYDAGEVEDETSRGLAQYCAHRRRLPLAGRHGALKLAQAIAADELDLLIYPDLGMTPAMFPVAALRLAPVQCAAWGHPVTTGLPNIDYFFSCAEMEPEDAPHHYSEHLLLLPGIGTGYRRPATPDPGSRRALGLPEGRNLYLFPHAPFKIHPDNDQVLADIAAADRLATFVFVQGRSAEAGKDLLDRIQAAFSMRGIPCRDRFLVLPYLSHSDYLRLNLLCDVLVDCMHWSGGNTTLDALACGLPVVSAGGATMRSRQSLAALRLLGAHELIASGGSQLARIAVHFAVDKAERNRVSAQLLARAPHLFDRNDFLPVLQDLLVKIVHESTL